MQGLVVGRYIFTDTSKREGGGIIFPGYGKAGLCFHQGRNSWGGVTPPQCLQMQFCRATCSKYVLFVGQGYLALL
jgi:hypothetical protein